mgnify:CR=1 FL=1
MALRLWGQDGVDNCRIPGLAITPKGTILAVYDARRGRNSDLQGDIDICYNRSTDGGRTWSEMGIAMDMGEWGGLPQKYNGVSDPCILVDDKTGDIYVSACWMHGVIDPETGEWVAKSDVGVESNTEAEKGQASDAFKRACVCWGSGRELYSAPNITVPANKTVIEKNKNGKLICKDKFAVQSIGYDKDRRICELAIFSASAKDVVYRFRK